MSKKSSRGGRPRGPIVEAPARLENPDQVPAWVYMEPPDQFNAVQLRGAAFFDQMAAYGVRVQRIPGVAAGSPGSDHADVEFQIFRPWTHIFVNVRGGDLAPFLDSLPPWCSMIMDCHFPIMDMEAAIGSNEQLIGVIDHKDELLANLALADAVTVSQKHWAADLAEINPNVFYLPDLQGPLTDAWALKMVEIATSAVAMRNKRLQMRKDMTG